MKKILFLTLTGLLYCSLSIGQGIKEGTMKSANDEFGVKRINKRLVVSNKKNGLKNTQNKLPDDVVKSNLSNFLTYDRDQAQRMLSLIKADFLKRGRSVPSERPLGVFYIGKDGEILEVEFIVSENTMMSIDDIDALETTLKEKYRFTVTKGKLGSAKFVIWNTILRLDEIAEK